MKKTPDQWVEWFAEKHETIEFKYLPEGFPPRRWLVEGLFLDGGKLNFVLGEPNAGKSRFIRWLIAHMIADLKPFGFRLECLNKKILYVGTEEGYEDFYTSLVRYGELIGADVKAWCRENLIYIAGAGMGLELAINREGFLQTILHHRPGLVIIDSMRYVWNGEENGGPELNAMVNEWRRWTTTFKFNMLINHHAGKLNEYSERDKLTTWVRGSSIISAVLDCAVALERFGAVDKDGGQKVKLYRWGRHAPTAEPWVFKDKGRADPNQAVSTDLGWTLVEKY